MEYVNIGNNYIICKSRILGVFDLDSTTVSAKTRDYLARKENEGRVITVNFELPRTFIVYLEKNGEEKVLLSPLSSDTLLKRI